MDALSIMRASTDDDGTYGVMLDGTKPFLVTLEESWKGNANNISCIPAGFYRCKRVHKPIHGECFQIMDVPGRSDVLIHWGNTEIDTEGCVITGESFGTLKALDDDTNQVENQAAVLNSKSAYKKFMDRMAGIDEFNLAVAWAEGVAHE